MIRRANVSSEEDTAATTDSLVESAAVKGNTSREKKRSPYNSIRFFFRLKPTLVAVYYMFVAFLLVSCLHLAEHYHFHLKYIVLTVAFLWTSTELRFFALRSRAFAYQLYTWLFWLSLIALLDWHWLLNPQAPWQHNYRACLRVSNNTSQLLFFERNNEPLSAYSVQATDSSAAVDVRSSSPDEYAEILATLGTSVQHVPVCNVRESTPRPGLTHAPFFYSGFLNFLSTLVLVAVALNSCTEYYRYGSSRNVNVYIVVCTLVVLLLPKPRPPSAGETMITCVCASLFFCLSYISSRVICVRNMIGERIKVLGTRYDSAYASTVDDAVFKANTYDDSKHIKAYIDERMQMSSLLQSLWVLFMWHWVPLFVFTTLQCVLYYRIYIKYTVIRSQEQRLDSVRVDTHTDERSPSSSSFSMTNRVRTTCSVAIDTTNAPTPPVVTVHNGQEQASRPAERTPHQPAVAQATLHSNKHRATTTSTTAAADSPTQQQQQKEATLSPDEGVEEKEQEAQTRTVTFSQFIQQKEFNRKQEPKKVAENEESRIATKTSSTISTGGVDDTAAPMISIDDSDDDDDEELQGVEVTVETIGELDFLSDMSSSKKQD